MTDLDEDQEEGAAGRGEFAVNLVWRTWNIFLPGHGNRYATIQGALRIEHALLAHTQKNSLIYSK